MANFKRHKTKAKDFDGKGFNQTKDRDAVAAAKGKGVPAKKAKLKKRFGLRISDLYPPDRNHYLQQLKWWTNPRVDEVWYEKERQRDSAAVSLAKNISYYVKLRIQRTIEKIER